MTTDARIRQALFRLDCNQQTGSGHFMRCLTLADALAQHNVQCTFLSRDLVPVFQQHLRAKGHLFRNLVTGSTSCEPAPSEHESVLAHADWLPCSPEQDALDCRRALADAPDGFDLLVVDHYALDARWERQMRSVARRVLVIDDLADRRHDADVLLDQNLGRRATDYDGLLPQGAGRLIGPTYALLRDEFMQARGASLARRAAVSTAKGLISLGGVDAANLTGTLLSCLVDFARAGKLGDQTPEQLTVILGAQSLHFESVQALARTAPFRVDVLQGVNDMAQRLAESDWAMGAAGASAWERCCLGVPSLIFVLAANQAPGAMALVDAKAAVLCKTAPSQVPSPQNLLGSLLELFSQCQTLAQTASALCDGNGARRVLSELGFMNE